jgi:hypothetical protein
MPGACAWHDANARGHFISFIAPGSVVVTGDPVRVGKCEEAPVRAGKCENAPLDEKAIVFGRAFLYPLEVM